MSELDWQDRSACKPTPGEDPIATKARTAAFFPPRGEIGNRISKRTKDTYCKGCPVQAECLEWALRLPTNDPGILGGMTAGERRSERRRRGLQVKVAECGTRSGCHRHQRLNQDPCPACRTANNEYLRTLRTRA